MRALRSCGSERTQCTTVIMAMPILFGPHLFLRGALRPARLSGACFSRHGPAAWRSLCPDPPSLSTGVDTGDCRATDRKPDDNARAKCGACECRQDQNHDHPSLQESNDPQIRLSSSADRHEMQIRCFKPVGSPIVRSTTALPVPWTPASAHHRSNYAAAMTTTGRRGRSAGRRTATSRTPHPPPARAFQADWHSTKSGRTPGRPGVAVSLGRPHRPLRSRHSHLTIATMAAPASAGASSARSAAISVVELGWVSYSSSRRPRREC